MEKSNYLNKINEGKTPITIDKSWFYHGFGGNLDTLTKILTNGLLCKKKLGIKRNPSHSHNGIHYISLTKYFEEEYSIFSLISSSPILIISSEVSAIKTVNTLKRYSFLDIFINTPLPFRTSTYNDEWQVYKKIDSKYFVGIYFDLLKNLKRNDEKEQLNKLKQIIEIIDCLGLELPIIDGSDNTKLDKKVIRKIKI